MCCIYESLRVVYNSSETVFLPRQNTLFHMWETVNDKHEGCKLSKTLNNKLKSLPFVLLHSFALKRLMKIMLRELLIPFSTLSLAYSYPHSLPPTWLVIRLVLVFRISEGQGRVLVTGLTGAVAGLDVAGAPQLHGSFWRDGAFRIRVSIRAGTQSIAVQ